MVLFAPTHLIHYCLNFMMHLLFLLQGKRLSLVWNVALLSYTGTYLKRIEKATISDHLASLLSKLENSLSRTTTLAA
jgi:hypothetical protein